MGNLSTDTQTYLNDLGVANAAAIKPITDFIGLIADVASGIGAVAGVVQLVVGWLAPSPDGTTQLNQIGKKLSNITNILQETINIQASKEILARNDEINSAVAPASTALGQIT